MKKLTDESKATIFLIFILFWCLFTSAIGHKELWIIPLLCFWALMSLYLILALVKDIYFAKRRERLYDKQYWERMYWEEYKENQREP